MDNDGDFDMFITNHNVAGQLLENIDNAYFVDISADAGVLVEGLSMQGTFRDFDNDGWLDLIVSGTINYIYRNTGNGNFERVPGPFPGRMITSYGIGDLNSDGFLDVYATYNDLYNDPSGVYDDVIWMNDAASGNNHLRVMLTGVQCNRSAVGARLYLYGAWGMQTREVRAGEGYGITNSLIQHFGLGQETGADSLVVVWPDGLREVYGDISGNATVVITQGGCKTTLLDLGQGPYTQCLAESFDISAPAGFAGYLWSTGDTTEQIIATDPGIYHVSLTDDEGCTWIAGPVIVSSGFQIEPVEIAVDVDGRVISCAGDTVILSAPSGAIGYLWNTGDTTLSIIPSTGGAFIVQATYECKTLTSDTVTIEMVDPNAFDVENDTIYTPGSGVLTAVADSVFWYDDPGTGPVASGPVYMTPVVDTTTTFYAQQIAIIPGERERVGPEEHTGNTFYNSNQANGAIRFDVLSRFRLDSVLVITEFPGARTVLIMNVGQDTLYRQTFEIDSGETFLPLGWWLEEGMDYLMTTDRDTNEMTFGAGSPRLFRSDGGFGLYPFVVPDVVELTGTATSQQFYYYFYDWHLSRENQVCTGDLQPVQVVLVDTTTSSVKQIVVEPLELIPNPASTRVSVSQKEILTGAERVEVFDARGKAVGGWILSKDSGTLDLSGLASGVYTIRTWGQGHIYLGRVVKL
jgi:hypothetical protein